MVFNDYGYKDIENKASLQKYAMYGYVFRAVIVI